MTIALVLFTAPHDPKRFHGLVACTVQQQKALHFSSIYLKFASFLLYLSTPNDDFFRLAINGH